MKDIFKIVRYSSSLKKYYLAATGLVVVSTALTLIPPFLIKSAVSGIQQLANGTAVPASFFVMISVALLAVSVAATLISNISGYIGDLLNEKLYSLLGQRYYDHVLQLPLEYYDNQVAGRVTSRLQRSIATVTGLIQAFTNNFIGMILTIVGTLVIISIYAWPVAILLAILFPLYIWLTTLSSRSWQARQEAINQDVDYAQGRFVEAINQIRVVKSFVQEQAESGLFSSKRRGIEQAAKAQSIEWHKYDLLRRWSLDVIFFLIIGYMIYQAYTGRFGLDVFVLLLQLIMQARFPLFASSFIVDQIQRAQAGSKDFFEVMDTKPSITNRPGAKELTVQQGSIKYTDVTFAYSDSPTKAVLENISFGVKPGQKVALVGESGEGKTTIANLLLRFYEPMKGSILIDEQDIAAVTQESLRQNIAVVFQEPALFSGTIADNIAYGSDSISQQQLEDAAKAANAYEFIQKLPQGFNSEIGERGVKLSGGQKQRIAIARAILKNAPILILDEATSSLDSKAEREVQDALERLMKGRTTIIIAHRLSTISNVDLIIGIKNGRIAEIGSPAQLAKQKGIYAELLSLQTPGRGHKAQLRKYDIAAK